MSSSGDDDDGDLGRPASKKGKPTSKKKTERIGEDMPGIKDREQEVMGRG